MALTQGDKKWLKVEMFDLLVDFHETVAKLTMEMLIKDAKKDIKEDLGAKIDSVDLKLTKGLDHYSGKIDDHDERISKFEASRYLAD